jgi:hypothetical protein
MVPPATGTVRDVVSSPKVPCELIEDLTDLVPLDVAEGRFDGQNLLAELIGTGTVYPPWVVQFVDRQMSASIRNCCSA